MNKKMIFAAPLAVAMIMTGVGSVQAAPSDTAQTQVLVKVKAGKSIDSVKQSLGLGASKDLGLEGWHLVTVPQGKADAVGQLKKHADVLAAEANATYTMDLAPSDPNYSSQYALPKVSAPQAWDITTGSTALTVAVIDTGVDLAHPDFEGRIVPGYDFVNNDAVAQDDQGHGTHCAGIIGANANNAYGTVGLDWKTKIMPIKVLSSTGSGATSNIINGVKWAADNGAKVISMSLSGTTYSQAFQDAINYAWNKGVIILGSAGNVGTSAIRYPSGYANVIAVASTDQNDVKSSFSTYGTWVDVTAPGSSILSSKLGGGTVSMSGTSMSTPLVAGLASLTWSMNPAYSNASVVNRIFATADPISGTGTYWVHGRVNAYRAVNGF